MQLNYLPLNREEICFRKKKQIKTKIYVKFKSHKDKDICFMNPCNIILQMFYVFYL